MGVHAALMRRRIGLSVAALFVAVGLLYSALWAPLVLHHQFWMQPGDIWGSFRAAHYIGWGDLGDIYARGTGYITTPGLAVLLSPFAVLASHFGLSESFPWANPHPTAWPMLDLVSLLCGGSALVALDAAAEFLEVPRRRRLVLCCAQAVLLWPVIVVWGHPEDAVALSFAVYALLACYSNRWRSGGWLLGAAVLFQPFTLLLVPVALVALELRSSIRFLSRVVVPSLVLLVIPLVQSWHDATYALIQQPTFPGINHPTPLLPLAIRLAPESRAVVNQDEWLNGHFVLTLHADKLTDVVSPGPGRLIALAIACALGLLARRRMLGTVAQFWLAAVVLACWSLMEPVMTPYYLWPPLAFGMICAFRAGRWRCVTATAAAIFAVYWSEKYLSPWAWWLPLIGAIAVVLYSGLQSEWLFSPASRGSDGFAQDLRAPAKVG